MPYLKWSDSSIRDLQRAYEFLAEKDKRVAQSAIRRIRAELRSMAAHPGLGRRVQGGNGRRREWVIQFGSSGYIAQYEAHAHHVLVLRIRHQRQLPLK